MVIVITGPESSGKSMLSEALSAALDMPMMKEYARTFLESKGGGSYDKDDIKHIARHQMVESLTYSRRYSSWVMDTDVLTSIIWLEDKYGPAPDWMKDTYIEPPYDCFYLLCYPDVPWEADDLREDEHRREELYGVYLSWLDKYEKKYAVIKGDNRKEQALGHLKDIHIG